MSFTCTLYQTKSEKIALDKVMESGNKSYSGTLINNSNVINPSILLAVGADTIARFNYMEISDFGRKYFITEITALTADTCMVSGHVDVLSTYKDGIRSNTALIGRSETKYNLYIDDNMYKVDSRTIIQCKEFTGGGAFQTTPGIALVLVG